MHGRYATSLLAALINSFPGSSAFQNFKLDKNRVQRFGCEVFYFITFWETEQKPALATLKKKSLLKQGEKIALREDSGQRSP